MPITIKNCAIITIREIRKTIRRIIKNSAFPLFRLIRPRVTGTKSPLMETTSFSKRQNHPRTTGTGTAAASTLDETIALQTRAREGGREGDNRLYPCPAAPNLLYMLLLLLLFFCVYNALLRNFGSKNFLRNSRSFTRGCRFPVTKYQSGTTRPYAVISFFGRSLSARGRKSRREFRSSGEKSKIRGHRWAWTTSSTFYSFFESINTPALVGIAVALKTDR